MTVNFAGHLYNDAGTAISGASVKLLETGTTTQEGSTVTTDSAGAWAFTEADQDRYDVEITSGSSVRRIRWDDQISLKELDVRNNTGATTPAATFTNLTNNAANQAAVFSGANSTRADDDEIYISYKLANSAGDLEEFARMTVVATDVTDGSEDGQFEFDVLQGGSLIKAFTIASSTAGAQSIDFNQDSITFGTGTAATDITLTFDAESADGVIAWMEDEDYFKFSDDVLMNSTERINFYDTAIYIYSSTDGQLDLVADTEVQIAATTIDINGAVALNGAITGATDITLSGELDAATLDISGNSDFDGTLDIAGDLTLSGGADGALQFTNAGENSIKIPDNQASALIIEEANNAYITFVTTNSSEAITVAKATTFSVAATLATGSTIGNITLADGSITDSSGALDFGNETLTTTGAVDFGAATVDSLSVSDANITNVGDIALDSISADGTDINVAVSDNSATALTIKQGSDAYLIVDTANSSESVSIGTGISGTAITLGHSTSETTVADNLTVTGTVTAGSDGSGTDVIFYSGTSGDNFTWDASEEVLQITGTNGATSLDVLDGDIRIVDTLYFYDRGGEYMSSDGSTLAIVGNTSVAGNLLPSADDTYDLGSASAAWQDLFLEGDITLTDSGTISTSAGTLNIKATTDTDIRRPGDGVVMNVTRNAVASWSFYVGHVPLDTSSAGATGVAGAGSLELRCDAGGTEFAILQAGTTTAKFVVNPGLGNVQIGGTADHSGTVGTNILSIFDGTAPVNTLANGCSFFSTSGQMRVIQADGTASDVSPHNPETGEWWFNSNNTVTGRVYRVHMERMMERLDEMLGGGFIEEFIEEV
jgi:hypothetical protein